MDKATKRFLKRLGKDISIDAPNVTDKEVNVFLKHMISDLPNGSLKADLLENRVECNVYLVRIVRKLRKETAAKEAPSTLEKDDDDTQNGESVSMSYSKAGGAAQNTPQQNRLNILPKIVKLLKSNANFDETSAKTIEELWESMKLEAVGCNKYCDFLVCTESSCDQKLLRNLMNLCFNYLFLDLQKISAAKSKKSAQQHLEPLGKFLLMCREKYAADEEDAAANPSYKDLVAALVSIYLDLFVIAHSGEDLGDDVCQHTRQLLKGLMESLGEKGLDSVLELSSSVGHNCSKLFSSLVRYLLREKPEQNFSHYLRYILTVRIWKDVLPGLKNTVMEAYGLRAPKKFIKWALQYQPSLANHFPMDLKFKGRVVTRFILDNTDKELLQLLKATITNFEMSRQGDATEESEEEVVEDAKTIKNRKKKEKKKMKKKMQKLGTTDEDEQVEEQSALFAIDKAPQSMDEDEEEDTAQQSMDEEEDTAMQTENGVGEVEVFDWTSFGGADNDDEEKTTKEGLDVDSSKTSALFTIDRQSVKRSAESDCDDEKPKKKRRKKNKKKKTETAIESQGQQPGQEVQNEDDFSEKVEGKKKKKKKNKKKTETTIESPDQQQAEMVQSKNSHSLSETKEGKKKKQGSAVDVQESDVVKAKKQKSLEDDAQNTNNDVGSSQAATHSVQNGTSDDVAGELTVEIGKQNPESEDRCSPVIPLIVTTPSKKRRKMSDLSLSDHERSLTRLDKKMSASSIIITTDVLEAPQVADISEAQQVADILEAPQVADISEAPQVADISEASQAETQNSSPKVELEVLDKRGRKISEKSMSDQECSDKTKRKTSLSPSKRVLPATGIISVSSSSESPVGTNTDVVNNSPVKSPPMSKNSTIGAVNTFTEIMKNVGHDIKEIVLDSTSGDESSSDMRLVPDLSVHLKTKSLQTDKRRSSSTVCDSAELLPTIREGGEFLPQTTETSCSTQLTEAADTAMSEKKSPSPRKRRRRQSSSVSVASSCVEEESTASAEAENQAESEARQPQSEKEVASPKKKRGKQQEESQAEAEQSVAKSTPQTQTGSKPKTPKSTTPVSRRTRSRVKPTPAKAALPAKEPETKDIPAVVTQSEALPVDETKPASPTKRPSRTASGRKISSPSKTDSDMTSKETEEVDPTKDNIGTPAAVRTATATKRRRTSTNIMAAEAKKASRKSLRLEPQTPLTPRPTRSSQSEKKENPTKSFTRLKANPEAGTPVPAAGKKECRAEDEIKSDKKERETTLSRDSPLKSSPMKKPASESGHEIETRSKSPQKGYNLRRSLVPQ